ncbi:TPA: hypothetical protein O7139_001935 [Salmonella enterica]|nr:hypothetical protein [Salmonella enterica]HDC2560001.1 hypothetical protein [Salmonella enterica]
MSGVLPAIKFNPIGYSQYIDVAKNLYILNIDDVYAYCELKSPSYDEGVEICRHLNFFRDLCEDLLNLDCRFGPYMPDSFDTKRLLAWLDGNVDLYKKLANKVQGLEEFVLL